MASQARTDPPLRSDGWFDSNGRPTIRAAEYLEGLESESVDILVRVDAIELRLDVLEALLFIEVTPTADYTTTRNEIVTCINTSLITIKLDATPDALEEVHTIRAGSVVKIDGNGKLIMGLYNSTGVSTITLNGIGQALQMIYNSTTDKWHIQ